MISFTLQKYMQCSEAYCEKRFHVKLQKRAKASITNATGAVR